MLYHIEFMGSRVGQTPIGPFDVHVSEQLSTNDAAADLSRRIRDVVVERLAVAPAPGAQDARPVIAAHTQIIIDNGTQTGSAHYGRSTLGTFTVRAIP